MWCWILFVPEDCLKSAFTILCVAECYRNTDIGHRLHQSLAHSVLVSTIGRLKLRQYFLCPKEALNCGVTCSILGRLKECRKPLCVKP